jgi:hypothetical protein
VSILQNHQVGEPTIARLPGIVNQGLTLCMEEDSHLPEHLVSLAAGAWSMWRTAVVRGAGFPASDVLKLSDLKCASAIDEIFEAEEESQRTRSQAISVLWGEIEKQENSDKRAQLERVLRRLQKSKLPQPNDITDELPDQVNAYLRMRARLNDARTGFLEAFQAATNRLANSLQDVAGSRNLREAVIWQNRHAYRTAIEPILQAGPENVRRGSKHRQHEELIANYLQRYCVKNDTIGFFGPVGWATFVPEGKRLSAKAGKSLLAERNVRFEAWCIDALAEKFAGNAEVIPWIKPRRIPLVYCDGAILYLPQHTPIRVLKEQAAIISACDGTRMAKEIAEEVIRIPDCKFRTAQEVYNFLGMLRNRNIVSLSPAVRLPYPLKVDLCLRELCDRIDNPKIHDPLLDALNEMEFARSAVQDAAGDSTLLNEALDHLETTFSRLTGMDSKTAAGRTYAARTVVYEDCRRDIDVEIGPEFIQELGPPLSLLLTSARWFTNELASRSRTLIEALYERLARRSGSRIVDAASFWLMTRETILDFDKGPVGEIMKMLQERWAAILDIQPGKRRLEFTSEQLTAMVWEAFHAPRPGWKLACYNSPDVMIVASSADAINRGEFQLILGELHLAAITVASWIFVAQHPSPEDLLRAVESDLPDPLVIPVLSKHEPGVTARTSLAFASPKDYFFEYSLEPSGAPAGRILPIGGLVVEKLEEGLVIRTRDGRLKFDVIEFLGSSLSNFVINCFKLIKPDAHTPRVTIDRLVVCRESWSFAPSEIQFANEKDEAERFVSARRWARKHDMPRFVFVKTPSEDKPCFVDFCSPIYVNILAKLIRRNIAERKEHPELARSAGSILVSEMLPAPDQTWLPGAQGEQYTSELRLVTVDMAK